MLRCYSFAALLLLSSGAFLNADVEKVKAEPKLERRSALALDEAESVLVSAQKDYEAGNIDEFRKGLQEASELTDLSYQSLQDTGKRARRDPKWFKRAEQRLVVILRRVDALAKDVASDDRAAVESVQKKMREVHDQLVQDIMTRK